MRSKIVSRAQLNDLARKLGLNKLIMVNQGSPGQFKSILGDAFEAFIGAMYLDKGYEYSKRIIINHIIKMHLDIDKLENLDLNYKSKLLEWTQKYKKEIEFKVIDEVGNGHRKQYIVEVLVDNKMQGKGRDFSIKAAEQNAAEKACSRLMTENDL